MAEVTRSARMERRALERLAATPDSTHGRRARALLVWLGERDLARAASESGLRVSQVQYWVRAFERGGAHVLAPPSASDAPQPRAVPAPPHARRPRGPRLRGSDAMVAALRRVLLFHFGRMGRLERAVFEADEEAIHDMRVAIRRFRAALRIARPFVPPKRLARLRVRLQEAAAVLGGVRDLDVILGDLRAHLAGNAGGADLTAWEAELDAQRAAAHAALRDYLAGKAFRRLRRDCRAFLTAAGASADPAAPDALSSPRVRDVVPAAIWGQLGAVRRYETITAPTPESLHALRIEIKRLRYLLEFFQSALGLRIRSTIELAVRAQDHLGRLHDAWVAAGLLRARIGAANVQEAAGLGGSVAYLAVLQQEIETRMRDFPALWEDLRSLPFRQRLARILARL